MQAWIFLQEDSETAVRKHFFTSGSDILPHSLILISPFHQQHEKDTLKTTVKERLTLWCFHSIP